MGMDREIIPPISPDGEKLFYNSDGELYWISVAIIEALRSKN